MITLNKNYYIESRPNNIVLVFQEMRIKTEKDGTEKPYKSTDETYHGSFKDALKSFFRKSIEGSKTAEELMKGIVDVEAKIDQLSETVLEELNTK